MTHVREKLSQYWQNIQGNLFPWLQEERGSLTEKQQQLITTLEIARIEEFVLEHRGHVGRPEKDRTAMARAFVAKVIYQCSTTRQLLDRLISDKVLRRICGWERHADVPTESTFSRAFAEFSENELAARAHAALIKAYQSGRLVGHISRDSTAIQAREKAVKNKENNAVRQKYKRGRPKKNEVREQRPDSRLKRQLKQSLRLMMEELSKVCDVGSKRNSKGHQENWKGYKLHIDTADGGIPISAILTSASVHDSQVAIPLTLLTQQRVTNCYDLMDAAYDAIIIREHSTSLGHVPLIDFNHRHKSDTRLFLPHEAERYKERNTAERVNARLKDEFGALTIRVRGHMKVMCHLMFGLLALTVDQLLRFVT